MALEMSYTNGEGFTGNYWKVLRYECDQMSKVANYLIALYKDQAARTAGKSPMYVQPYGVSGATFDAMFGIPSPLSLVDKNPVEEIYASAKLQTAPICFVQIDAPTGLAVAAQGTTGATTYGYKVTAVAYNGETTPCAEVQITDGNATLSGTDFNRITWAAVAGATAYRVYRITGGATQGKVSEVLSTVLTLDDTGLAASGSAPVTNTTGATDV